MKPGRHTGFNHAAERQAQRCDLGWSNSKVVLPASKHDIK